MKKIMKKALSLALVLVMMLTLAPMTAKAADSSLTVGSVGTVSADGLNSYQYTYEAEADGTLTIMFEMFNWTCNVWEGTTVGMGGTQVAYGYGADATSSADNKIDAAVEEGKTYTVVFYFDEAGDYMYMASFAESTGEESTTEGTTPETAIPLTSAYVSVAAGATTYYKVTTEAGAAYTLNLYNRTGAAFDLFLLNPMLGSYGYYGSSTNGILDAYVTAEGTEYIFAIGNPGDMEVAVQVTMTADGEGDDESGDDTSGDTTSTLGTTANPDVLVFDEEIEHVNDGNGKYWYKWVATEAGIVTITPGTCADGWDASVFEGEDLATYVGSYNSNENDVAEFAVAAGDVVMLGITTYSWNAGTVNFTATFEAGSSEGGNDEPGTDEPGTDEPGTDEPATGEEIKEGYYYSFDELTYGANELVLMEGYDVTLFVYEPVTTGTYTFTVTEGTVGYYGTNVWFPYNGDELTETVTVNYTDTNCMAPIVIGISDAQATNLTITRAGEAQEETKIPERAPVVSAPSYVFTGDVEDLEYVDVLDKTEDKAVLGEDGYYHLNTADGPIILVNLYDEILALANATATGKVAIAVYEDGKVVEIINCNFMIDAYAASADKESGLYPLTAELMEIYKVYGEQQGWYTETGFVGGQLELGNPADAWMFACMYLPNPVEDEDNDTPVVDDNKPGEEDDDESIKIPPTAVEDGVVNSEVLDEIIKDAVESGKPVVVPTTNEGVTIIFGAEDLKDAESVSLNVKVEVVADVEDETVAKNDKITADNFVLKIEFAHEGKLPAKATITIAVGEAYKNTTLYYYQILADGTLKYVCDAPVDADGNAKVTQAHCSDYVLLSEKIEEGIDVPGTGDNTNVALWYAILALGFVALAGSVVMKKREF